MEFYESANFSHDNNDEMAPQLQQEFQSSLHLNICQSGTELLKYSNFQFPNNDSNVCLATLSKKCEVNSKQTYHQQHANGKNLGLLKCSH